MIQGKIILEDGSSQRVNLYNYTQPCVGEIVFNTSMTGYQEIATDPSYCDQVVVMTYPLIGNYGINKKSNESRGSYLKAMVMRELCDQPSHCESQQSLLDFFREMGVVGVDGADTRSLTKKIRSRGTMKVVIADDLTTEEEITQLFQKELSIDQVSRVSVQENQKSSLNKYDYKIALIDYGCKQNIVRELERKGFAVDIYPWNVSADEILQHDYAGVVLSNGPGDPKSVMEATETIKGLCGRLPILGICLGHQLIALAHGADTEKMKFGHRGANHPVKDVYSGRVYMTSQNHGYTVKNESLQQTSLKITHVNVNDKTIEGVESEDYPLFSVQFHPEAHPGPSDTSYLFDRFKNMVEGYYASES